MEFDVPIQKIKIIKERKKQNKMINSYIYRPNNYTKFNRILFLHSRVLSSRRLALLFSKGYTTTFHKATKELPN